MPNLTAPDHLDGKCLLTLARLGWLLTRQLGALCYPGLHPRTVRWRLDRLKAHGLVSGFHAASDPAPRSGTRKIPTKLGQIWRLLPPAIPHLEWLYPELDLEARKPYVDQGPHCTIAHQVEIVDILIILLHGLERIPGLIGIDVERDKWLYHVGSRRLRVDTVVTVRRRLDGSQTAYEPGYGVPWLRGPLAHDQAERALWVDIVSSNPNREYQLRDYYCRMLVERLWLDTFVPPKPTFILKPGISLAYLKGIWRDQPQLPIQAATLDDLRRYGAMAPVWWRRGRGVEETAPLYTRFADPIFEDRGIPLWSADGPPR